MHAGHVSARDPAAIGALWWVQDKFAEHDEDDDVSTVTLREYKAFIKDVRDFIMQMGAVTPNPDSDSREYLASLEKEERNSRAEYQQTTANKARVKGQAEKKSSACVVL